MSWQSYVREPVLDARVVFFFVKHVFSFVPSRSLTLLVAGEGGRGDG
jgi:hypothetical protein